LRRTYLPFTVACRIGLTSLVDRRHYAKLKFLAGLLNGLLSTPRSFYPSLIAKFLLTNLPITYTPILYYNQPIIMQLMNLYTARISRFDLYIFVLVTFTYYILYIHKYVLIVSRYSIIYYVTQRPYIVHIVQ